MYLYVFLFYFYLFILQIINIQDIIRSESIAEMKDVYPFWVYFCYHNQMHSSFNLLYCICNCFIETAWLLLKRVFWVLL